jgi:chromosome segregation ATPase
MNNKIIATIAIVVCIGLALGLFAIKKDGERRHAEDLSSISNLSNLLETANTKITEISDVNVAISSELTNRQQQLAQLSNNLVSANASLVDNQAALAGAQLQITNLNTRIADLELQNRSLDERAAELTNTIAKLDLTIADIKARLAGAESQNTYLQKELQKQMAAKADLEHKFNDLNALRAQLAKVKEDLFQARHAQLMRNDTTGKKGAQLINSRTLPVPGKDTAAPNSGLNVEIGTDGSVRIIPPLGATNAPPSQP